MSLREPITPESLCVALNRATSLRLAPRDVVLAYHHWRWVAHVPDQRIAFVADTVDARQRAPSEPPLATSIERTRVNMAIGIDGAALQAQVQEGLALFDALEIGNNEVVLVHGDLGSHNVAFAPETSEVLGVYDFDAIACVDRHWDFKYLHSYTPPFRQAVLEA